MKKLALLILVTLPLFAKFEVRAEVIYWKPTTGGLYLGIVDDRVTLLRSRHDWGFSLSGRYWLACTFGEIQYTHIDARDYRKLNKSIEPPFGGPPATRIEAREAFDFDSVEGRIGYRFYDQCNLYGALFVSVEACVADANSRIQYVGIRSVREKTCYRGIGPGLGIEGSFFLCQGLGVTARIGTVVLIGERRFNDTERLYPSECALVPAFNGRLALVYRYRIVVVELGYEVRHYPNAFVRGVFENGGFVPQLRDLTYGGPFAALQVCF